MMNGNHTTWGFEDMRLREEEEKMEDDNERRSISVAVDERFERYCKFQLNNGALPTSAGKTASDAR